MVNKKRNLDRRSVTKSHVRSNMEIQHTTKLSKQEKEDPV